LEVNGELKRITTLPPASQSARLDLNQDPPVAGLHTIGRPCALAHVVPA